jgi:hypothetical protein
MRSLDTGRIFHGSDTWRPTFFGSIVFHQTDLCAQSDETSLICDFELSIMSCHEIQFTVGA